MVRGAQALSENVGNTEAFQAVADHFGITRQTHPLFRGQCYPSTHLGHIDRHAVPIKRMAEVRPTKTTGFGTRPLAPGNGLGGSAASGGRRLCWDRAGLWSPSVDRLAVRSVDFSTQVRRVRCLAVIVTRVATERNSHPLERSKNYCYVGAGRSSRRGTTPRRRNAASSWPNPSLSHRAMTRRKAPNGIVRPSRNNHEEARSNRHHHRNPYGQAVA